MGTASASPMTPVQGLGGIVVGVRGQAELDAMHALSVLGWVEHGACPASGSLCIALTAGSFKLQMACPKDRAA